MELISINTHTNSKTIMIFLLFTSINLSSILAQEGINSSGGDSSNPQGSISYSLGQVFSTSEIGTTGSVSTGVQQVYEITTISGFSQSDVALGLTAFPNPATEALRIKIDHFENADLNYQLYDLQGKLLESGLLKEKETSIKMTHLPASTYILAVTSKGGEIRAFRIIKN